MNLLVFVLVCVSICLLFGVNSKDLQTLLRWQRKPTLKQKIKAADSHNQGFVAVQLAEIRQILAIYNLPGGIWLVYAVAVGLSLVGLGLSNLMDNPFVAPVLMLVLFLFPFVAIKGFWLYKEKQVAKTLESSLNAITSTYLRSDAGIIAAISENIPYLPNPLQQVFQHFLNQVTYIDSNVKDALENTKLTIHNRIFHQWIDVLIQAESDHTLKKNLSKILDKFSLNRDAQAEVASIIADAQNSYLMILVLSLFAPLIFYFTSKDWWNLLVEHPIGKMLTALYLVGIFVSMCIAYMAHQQSIVEGE